MIAKVLYIEGCDFERFPAGGTLNFALQMLKVFGNRLALVGISTDETPVGRWVRKNLNGVEYDFFAVRHRDKMADKPLIPSRLSDYIQFSRHKKNIMSLGIRDAFVREQEVLLAVCNWGWNNVCYFFPGTANPLRISRYRYSWLLSWLFERMFFRAVTSTDVILAAADDESIREMICRSRGLLTEERITPFPTHVDTSVFYPVQRRAARNFLGLPHEKQIIVTSGRIHWAKGWDLLTKAFKLFINKNGNSLFYFIGDGEDRPRLLDYVKSEGLSDCVRVTGYQTPENVSKYLNAADLFVMGSLSEGWPTAMVEALACGKPMVSTKVSGASSIITQNVNGLVVDDRNPRKFAQAMADALELKDAAGHNARETEKYALKNLKQNLEKAWPVLNQ